MKVPVYCIAVVNGMRECMGEPWEKMLMNCIRAFFLSRTGLAIGMKGGYLGYTHIL
jgi:hypothetical protein